jgi:hypothetical protein
MCQLDVQIEGRNEGQVVMTVTTQRNAMLKHEKKANQCFKTSVTSAFDGNGLGSQ